MCIETLAPAVIHWSSDDWDTSGDVSSIDTRLGIHVRSCLLEHSCGKSGEVYNLLAGGRTLGRGGLPVVVIPSTDWKVFDILH